MTNWKGHRKNNQHILVDIIQDYDKGTKENLGNQASKAKNQNLEPHKYNVRKSGLMDFWTLPVVPYTTKQQRVRCSGNWI
jgi:hypothetical protein